MSTISPSSENGSLTQTTRAAAKVYAHLHALYFLPITVLLQDQPHLCFDPWLKSSSNAFAAVLPKHHTKKQLRQTLNRAEFLQPNGIDIIGELSTCELSDGSACIYGSLDALQAARILLHASAITRNEKQTARILNCSQMPLLLRNCLAYQSAAKECAGASASTTVLAQLSNYALAIYIAWLQADCAVDEVAEISKRARLRGVGEFANTFERLLNENKVGHMQLLPCRWTSHKIPAYRQKLAKPKFLWTPKQALDCAFQHTPRSAKHILHEDSSSRQLTKTLKYHRNTYSRPCLDQTMHALVGKLLRLEVQDTEISSARLRFVQKCIIYGDAYAWPLSTFVDVTFDNGWFSDVSEDTQPLCVPTPVPTASVLQTASVAVEEVSQQILKSPQITQTAKPAFAETLSPEIHSSSSCSQESDTEISNESEEEERYFAQLPTCKRKFEQCETSFVPQSKFQRLPIFEEVLLQQAANLAT